MDAQGDAEAPLPDWLAELAGILVETQHKLLEGLREECNRLTSERDDVKPGDKLKAKILDHFVRRLEGPCDIANLTRVIQELIEIAVWLPTTDAWLKSSPEERKSKKIVFIQGMDLDQQTKEAVYKEVIYKAGRPSETRFLAVPALELRMQGLGWRQIEELLLPHRRGVQNPGESIRREVQLFREKLRRLGIPIELA